MAENGASGEKRKADDVTNGDGVAKKGKVEAGTILFSGATDWKVYCPILLEDVVFVDFADTACYLPGRR